MPQSNPAIAIDTSFYNSVGGIGTYTWQLLQHLPEFLSNQQCLFLENQLPQTMSLYQDDPKSDKRNLKNLNINFHNVTCQYKIRPYWSMFIVPKLLNQFQPKVFHALDGVSIPAYKTQTKYIVTIHDLIPLLYPKFSRTRDALACKYLMPNAIKKSEIILCDSHYIAQQVMDYIPSCSPKVQVIHLGVDLQYFKPSTDKPETHQKLCQLTGIPDQPYILTVVTRSPRRNLNRLLQAFEMFLHQSRNDSIQLVIAGGHGWKNESFMKYLQNHAFKKRIHLTGSVSDQTLLWLYQAAELFAFPSLQEGFGLPVLEAMASGVPVVCSDTTSLAEVGENAAFLIEPNDADSIANAFLKLTVDQNLYNQHQQKGLERVKTFSWRKTAQKTAEVYQSLL